MEFRPTNTTAIKLPLSIHAKTRNICWYVDRETFELIESPEYILEIRQIPVADIEGLDIPFHAVQQELSVDRKGGCSSDETRNLGTMLVEQGTRHNMMRNIAVFERTHGKSREECESTLEQWLKQQDRRLIQSDEAAVRCDMEELINWVYSDRFELNRPAASKKKGLGASQLRWILEISGRSNRRVLFLLLMRCILEHPSMSVKDMSKAVGISQPTIHKTIQRLLGMKRIEKRNGRHMKLPDGTYRQECSSYAVDFPPSGRNEQTMEITMRELVFDFDRCYHEAFDKLIPRFVLRQKLDNGEWQEYMQHLEAKRFAENQSKTPQRIDQIGKAHMLENCEYGQLITYEVRGRFLYPACEVCKCLRLTYPSQRASLCKHKEAWYVQAQSKSSVEAKAIRRNYIPAEDVKALARCSRDPEAEAICRWILSNETGVIE